MDELYRTVVQTAEAEACVQQRDMAGILSRLQCPSDRQGRPASASSVAELLSDREQEVAALLGQHLSNKEIAYRLGISVHTVKHHVRNTLTKLGVERRSRAASMLQSQPRI